MALKKVQTVIYFLNMLSEQADTTFNFTLVC